MNPGPWRRMMNWEVKYYPEFWNGKRLAYPHVSKESPKFARSIVVGNLIFVSGCTGQDTIRGGPTADNFEDQMNMALEKVKMAMEEAGSSLENVVKTLMLIKHRDDYPRMRRTEVEFYMKHAPYLVEKPPASTFMVPASLARPEFLIEMDVIGVVDREAPGWPLKFYPEFWAGKRLSFPHVPKESPKFARTEAVGNMIVVSGCTGQNPENLKVEAMDIEGQARIAFRKMIKGLEEAGGSLNNLVKTYVLLRDMKDLQKYRKVEREYFKWHAPDLLKNPPASTAIQATSLALPDFLIEVEAFAAISKGSPGWEVKSTKGGKEAAAGVSLGNLLFLSACEGSNPQTGRVDTNAVEEQVHLALDKVKSSLETSGSSLDKVVKTFMLLKRLEDYPKMRKAEVEYYEKHAPYLVENPPVSTFMQLSDLTRPGALFEIDVTAVLETP